MCVFECGWIDRQRDRQTCHKELAHAIMEASKLHDLQSESASCRLKRANDNSSSLKASRLETQEERMFQLKSEGRKKTDAPV